MGVDRVEVLQFTKGFSTMTTEDYLRMLIEKYGVRTILLGYDNRMGSDAKGADEVARAAENLGIEVLRAEMVPSESGYAVSSTMVELTA